MQIPGQRHFQTGQTLIETLVAVFMLVMGISAALGLAIYALNSSRSISKQIVATGLAREGIEAVKDMRDTNWLKQLVLDQNCFNYLTLNEDSQCYKDWLGDASNSITPFCLNSGTGDPGCNGGAAVESFYLGFDSSSVNYWVLNDANKYGLVFSPSPGTGGLYSPGVTCSDSSAGISDYCRKIKLTLNFTAPYNHPAGPTYDRSDTGPMVQVQSEVWWVDKNCPRVADYDQANSACRLELDAYLTNWKNY